MGEIAYSFLTNCRDRLDDLKQTLPVNLALLNDGDEIVLLDYHCPAQCGAWAVSAFPDAVKAKRLRVYREGTAPRFLMPHAKNVSHLLGRGSVLVNLDADNYLDAAFLADLRSRDWFACQVSACGNAGNGGASGRIAIRADALREMGGYDERLSLGYSYDDIDLLQRCRARRLAVGSHAVQPTSVIPTSDAAKAAWQLDPTMPIRVSNRTHQAMSREAIRQGRLVANAGRWWGEAKLEILHDPGWLRLTGCCGTDERRTLFTGHLGT